LARANPPTERRESRGRCALRIPTEVAELLRGLHPQLKRKLRAALSDIVADPYLGKALKDELAGLRSLRVGKFRIVYRIRERATQYSIEIVACGPRVRIYEETYRQVSGSR
jgi:mRNA interferase RelE/StbE